MNLSDFSETEVQFARDLWSMRHGFQLHTSQEWERWERIKPEVQLEFCLYARAIYEREFRQLAVARLNDGYGAVLPDGGASE